MQTDASIIIKVATSYKTKNWRNTCLCRTLGASLWVTITAQAEGISSEADNLWQPRGRASFTCLFKTWLWHFNFWDSLQNWANLGMGSWSLAVTLIPKLTLPPMFSSCLSPLSNLPLSSSLSSTTCHLFTISSPSHTIFQAPRKLASSSSSMGSSSMISPSAGTLYLWNMNAWSMSQFWFFCHLNFAGDCSFSPCEGWFGRKARKKRKKDVAHNHKSRRLFRRWTILSILTEINLFHNPKLWLNSAIFNLAWLSLVDSLRLILALWFYKNYSNTKTKFARIDVSKGSIPIDWGVNTSHFCFIWSWFFLPSLVWNLAEQLTPLELS